MPRDVARDDLYTARINLWVEDDTTRAYLGALWNDPEVKFLVGGGQHGVLAILHDAEIAGYRNVFGVVDRDHGRSNYADWLVPGRQFRRFILPRHELENYLLDALALEGCQLNTHRRTAAEIDRVLDNEAERRCWGVACRLVVSFIHDQFDHRFMKQPKMPPVDSEASARDHILQSAWFQRLPRKTSSLTEARVHRLLAAAHARTERMRDDGNWRVMFSGKEILRVAGNYIYNPPTSSNQRSSTSEFDADLAKAIANWQVSNTKVPTDLVNLLAALKARIAPKN